MGWWSFCNMQRGREQISWSAIAIVLVLRRFCEPSSELYVAEQSYNASALSDLFGVPAERVNDDCSVAHSTSCCRIKQRCKYLKTRLGELFQLKYESLLCDDQYLF
jgi:hypothetical protein